MLYGDTLSDKMDILDMKILSRLLNNCRESDRQIGLELGVSGGAVRARIKKMQQSGIIEDFFIKVEPPVLGYGILYFVVSGEDIKEILEQVSLVGEPFVVVPCVGGITVCGIVIREDLEQKVELASKLMKDLRVLTIFEADSNNAGFDSNLTKTDLEILGELISDPRQKIEKIAKKTGLSTKTVARCIGKLRENDGIQFTLVYDPQKIKGFIPHVILAWVQDDLKGTLENMNKVFSDSYLQIPFIAKNQIVLFMYSDSIFRMDEVTQRVRNIKNVKSTDLFIPKKISFYDKWLDRAVGDFKKSPTLHLAYQTN